LIAYLDLVLTSSSTGNVIEVGHRLAHDIYVWHRTSTWVFILFEFELCWNILEIMNIKKEGPRRVRLAYAAEESEFHTLIIVFFYILDM